jgi:hypothetical protein
MTAIITITTEDGIQIYTDSATYDQQGYMVQESAKCRASLLGPFAVVGRGDAELTRLGSSALMKAGELGGFDAAAMLLPDVVEGLVRRAADAGDFVNLAFILAGWSIRHQDWKTYRIFAAGPTPDDLGEHAGIAYEPTWFHVEPEMSMDELRGLGLLDEGKGLCWGGHDSALQIFKFLREKPLQIYPPAPDEGCVVGGALHAISLSDDGVLMQQVFRWPDHLGCKLGGPAEG